MGRLDRYSEMRNFERTPEPAGTPVSQSLALRYSMQKHAATRLHWDLRLEWHGALLSWAVTRGPSLAPEEKRLAVRTEDHPVDYLDFEGVIPKGNYGAGTVMLWDLGHWQPLIPVDKGLAKGHLHFRLHGLRMTGGWHLVRMKERGSADRGRENWLLMKEADEAAGRADPVRSYTRSVLTRRTMRSISDEKPAAHAQRAGRSPKFRKPQLAQVAKELVESDDIWHEMKFDGYRALVSLGNKGTRIFTRNGHDWSDRYASLLPAFDALETEAALIDGEIVAGAGLDGFGTLQKAIKNNGPYTFFAFDLLSNEGRDLTKDPLGTRRKALEALFKQAPPLGLIQLSPVIRGNASGSFDAVCTAGGEGLIAKRISAAYRAGRSPAWKKIKCQKRDDFVIIGTQKSSARARPFASLLLAEQTDGGLEYVGKVGTGFDAGTMDEIAAALAPLKHKKPGVAAPPGETRDVTWVTPKLFAEVTFAERTADGRLRHAVFEGLREDLVIKQKRNESGPKVAGIPISSADRVVFPTPGMTKLDVVRYYEAVADELLAETSNRPLSLVRLPTGMKGGRFFQKHAGKGFPKALKTVEIEESDGTRKPYMYVTDVAGLVAAAQMGTIEFHIWGARRDRLDRPDRLVFDLDPDEGLDFARVKAAAVHLRDRLGDLGLKSWPMVTGGKGVHIVVPLRRTAGWQTVRLFSQTFATLLAAEEPRMFTAELSKARRKGRIFVDWLRNERGATAIAPFSLRAREGAPAATPVSWEELSTLRRAGAFDIATARDRSWSNLSVPRPQSIGRKEIAKLEGLVAP